MKIYIKLYSIIKLYFFFNFKIKNKIIIIVFIKKNKLNYFFFKKNIFYNINKNFVLSIHKCNNKNIIHSFKHLLKINHNSILEKKINDFF